MGVALVQCKAIPWTAIPHNIMEPVHARRRECSVGTNPTSPRACLVICSECRSYFTRHKYYISVLLAINFVAHVLKFSLTKWGPLCRVLPDSKRFSASSVKIHKRLEVEKTTIWSALQRVGGPALLGPHRDSNAPRPTCRGAPHKNHMTARTGPRANLAGAFIEPEVTTATTTTTKCASKGKSANIPRLQNSDPGNSCGSHSRICVGKELTPVYFGEVSAPLTSP